MPIASNERVNLSQTAAFERFAPDLRNVSGMFRRFECATLEQRKMEKALEVLRSAPSHRS